MTRMRRTLLLAGVALWPLLAPPALAQGAETSPVRVRTGQHADRGRVVLHFGAMPTYALRKVSGGYELRLRGQYPLDLSTTRRLSELSAIETRQDGGETVVLLRTDGEQTAEAGAFDGMLYVDLRAAAAPRGASTLEAAQRRLLDDAVRLGLMKPEQATAMLQAARPGSAVVAAPVPAAPPAGPPAPPVNDAQVTAAPPPAAVPAVAPAVQAERMPSRDDLAVLRDAVVAKLAVLNGLQPGAAGPAAPNAPAPQPGTVPAVATAAASPVRAEPEPAPTLLACTAPFSMQGWKGDAPFADRLPVLRAALAQSDQGAAETADLAEFYVGHELAREAMEVLTSPQAEAPAGALRERLDRVRDVARLLLGRPVSPTSPLLAEAADCAREDLPLWQALAAAVSGDRAVLARLAPRARSALREVPQDLRLVFVQRLADAVEDDPATLRILLGSIRPATGLTPEQAAARSWQYARLARQEGHRGDEAQYLEQAARTGGRSLPEIFARARLAALSLGRPGAEGRKAESQINDVLRTYRHDALGEEAAIAYASRLLEQGALGHALAIADGASQASARPGMESRGAGLAATALRRLLAESAPEGQTLPEPGERLGLFWQYEGYATPGERGDDIRLAAMRLLLRQGLAEAARDLGQQISPVTARTPDAGLLLARAEATAAQGDPRRALALLGTLPVGEESRRAAAAALARLDRPEEAAAQLDGLRGTADLNRRAELLFQAQSWRAAGAAYGELLRDPALPANDRPEATARLASASALAQQRTSVPAELLAPEAGSAALLRLTETAPPAGTGIAGVRGAIERSRQIEALLPPVGGT
jgi:hypothetical protein